MDKNINFVLCIYWWIICANATLTLKSLNLKESKLANKAMISTWNYALDPENSIKEYTDAMLKVSKERHALRNLITTLKFDEFANPDMQRQLDLFSRKGDYSLLEDTYIELINIVHDIVNVYRNNTIYKLNFNAIESYMAKNRDAAELEDLWISFHNTVGPQLAKLFSMFTNSMNSAAKDNNMHDAGDIWLLVYDFTFLDQVRSLWNNFSPLYMQLHAYVRHKLRETYGDIVSSQGPIPIHLLGSIFGNSWSNLFDILSPYPSKNFVDVNSELSSHNYSMSTIAQKAEEYFKALDFEPLPDNFWEKSLFFRPSDALKMICSSRAFYFYDNKDFRIRFCGELTHESFLEVHDYLANIHIASLMTHLPHIYQYEVVPGFFDTLGRVLTIPSRSTKYLRTAFMPNQPAQPEEVFNNLFFNALDVLSSISYYHMVDCFRYQTYSNNLKKDSYNKLWWELRYTIQGIQPPAVRGSQHFDVDLGFAIDEEFQYYANFYSIAMSYDIFREICISTGEYNIMSQGKPLFQCELNKSSDAFQRFINTARTGRSLPWKQIQTRLLREHVSISGIFEFFEPLFSWLQKENAKNNVFVGWKQTAVKHRVSFSANFD